MYSCSYFVNGRKKSGHSTAELSHLGMLFSIQKGRNKFYSVWPLSFCILPSLCLYFEVDHELVKQHNMSQHVASSLSTKEMRSQDVMPQWRKFHLEQVLWWTQSYILCHSKAAFFVWGKVRLPVSLSKFHEVVNTVFNHLVSICCNIAACFLGQDNHRQDPYLQFVSISTSQVGPRKSFSGATPLVPSCSSVLNLRGKLWVFNIPNVSYKLWKLKDLKTGVVLTHTCIHFLNLHVCTELTTRSARLKEEFKTQVSRVSRLKFQVTTQLLGIQPLSGIFLSGHSDRLSPWCIIHDFTVQANKLLWLVTQRCHHLHANWEWYLPVIGIHGSLLDWSQGTTLPGDCPQYADWVAMSHRQLSVGNQRL